MGEQPSNLRDVHRPEQTDERLDDKIARELESSTPVDANDLVDRINQTKINKYGELEE